MIVFMLVSKLIISNFVNIFQLDCSVLSAIKLYKRLMFTLLVIR